MSEFNFDYYGQKNTNKVSSSSTLKIGIRKQEVAFLQLITLQEVVPLLANSKSHYYSIKMKIKVLNMCQICPLIIKT